MTTTPFADPTPAPSKRSKLDQDPLVKNGRYYLPHPDTGEKSYFTRATTVAKTLPDLFNVNQWEKRVIVKGMAMSPELVMAAGPIPLDDDRQHKKDLQDIAYRAKERAGGNEGSTRGKAFHTLTEIVDRGEPIPIGTSPDHVKQLKLYRESLDGIGAVVHPAWMERLVWNREFGIVGRTDRALLVDPEKLLDEGRNRYIRPGASASIIGDVKSQKSMDFGCMDIGVQLAIYAHADLTWNEETLEWEEPDIELNRDVAVVMHVPSNDSNVADIHVIDIARGWELVQVAMEVRAARKETLNRKLERPGGNDWGRAIMNATTKQELSRIWSEANAAGEWTDKLLELGKARQAEIEKGEAA